MRGLCFSLGACEKIKLSYIGTQCDARDRSSGKAGRVQWLSVAARGQAWIMLVTTGVNVKVD